MKKACQPQRQAAPAVSTLVAVLVLHAYNTEANVHTRTWNSSRYHGQCGTSPRPKESIASGTRVTFAFAWSKKRRGVCGASVCVCGGGTRTWAQAVRDSLGRRGRQWCAACCSRTARTRGRLGSTHQRGRILYSSAHTRPCRAGPHQNSEAVIDGNNHPTYHRHKSCDPHAVKLAGARPRSRHAQTPCYSSGGT